MNSTNNLCELESLQMRTQARPYLDRLDIYLYRTKLSHAQIPGPQKLSKLVCIILIN